MNPAGDWIIFDEATDLSDLDWKRILKYMESDKLRCTSDDMDSLHGALHRRRAGSLEVKVPVEILSKLLFDHADALTLLKRPGGPR